MHQPADDERLTAEEDVAASNAAAFVDWSLDQRKWLMALTPILQARCDWPEGHDRFEWVQMVSAVCSRIRRICEADIKGESDAE